MDVYVVWGGIRLKYFTYRYSSFYDSLSDIGLFRKNTIYLFTL